MKWETFTTTQAKRKAIANHFLSTIACAMSTEIEKRRRPFTPGWAESLETVQGLPIKYGGKVIPVVRPKKRNLEEEEAEVIYDDSDNDEDVEPNDNRARKFADRSQAKKAVLEISVEPKTDAQYALNRQTIAEICMSITANPESALRKKANKSSEENPDFAQHNIKDLLAFTICQDPIEIELALISTTLVFKDICPGYRIRSSLDMGKDEEGNAVKLKKETKKLVDFEKSLLQYYQYFLQILEKRAHWGLAHLSHGHTLSPSDQRLVSIKTQLGLTAYRCQCELLRSLTHFNFRSSLLTAITNRCSSISPSAAITTEGQQLISTCCEAIDYILRRDATGEVSFEFVSLLNKVLRTAKSTLPERLLQCLEIVKVTVKADYAKLIHTQSKNEKKKRKKEQDKVELGLLEANLSGDEINKKRFQVNSLQEMALLYFRLLKAAVNTDAPSNAKGKGHTHEVTYRLLPAALAGLSRLTHLLDVDMIGDLLAVLRTLLDQPVTAVKQAGDLIEVRLLCIFCALKTLSGPGSIALQMDDEPYLAHLLRLLPTMPSSFTRWTVLIQCLEGHFLTHREERGQIVEAFIAQLILAALEHIDTAGPVLLTMAHMMLLRYPRVRQGLALYSVLQKDAAQQKKDKLAQAQMTAQRISQQAKRVIFEEDGNVADLAMTGLLSTTNTISSTIIATGGHGSVFNTNNNNGDDMITLEQCLWLLPLFQQHPRREYARIVKAMISKDLQPLPIRVDDLEGDRGVRVMTQVSLTGTA